MTSEDQKPSSAGPNPSAADRLQEADADEALRPHRTRRRFIVGSAIALAVTAGGIGGLRVAQAGPTPPPSAKTVQQDDRLVQLNSWIEGQPCIRASGYIDSVNSPNTGSTVLLWHGPANSTQQRIRDKARDLGLNVTVQQRRYSSADIDRALKKLDGRSRKGAFKDFNINSVVGISATFDGVTVRGDYTHPLTGSRADADAALAKAATAEFDIAIAVEPGGEFMPA